VTKLELSRAVAQETEITYVKSAEVIDTVFRIIANKLSAGEDVRIYGFGIFEPVKRSERTGRDIASGETITIPAKTIPVFRPGKTLKEEMIHGTDNNS
jgi:DNA-binding protein HU-beta